MEASGKDGSSSDGTPRLSAGRAFADQGPWGIPTAAWMRALGCLVTVTPVNPVAHPARIFGPPSGIGMFSFVCFVFVVEGSQPIWF